jgi:hypothetical protein
MDCLSDKEGWGMSSGKREEGMSRPVGERLFISY